MGLTTETPKSAIAAVTDRVRQRDLAGTCGFGPVPVRCGAFKEILADHRAFLAVFDCFKAYALPQSGFPDWTLWQVGRGVQVGGVNRGGGDGFS